jgi:hypothetical protein
MKVLLLSLISIGLFLTACSSKEVKKDTSYDASKQRAISQKAHEELNMELKK